MAEVIRKIFLSILLIGLSSGAIAEEKPFNLDWLRLQFLVVNRTEVGQTISMVNPETPYPAFGGGVFDTHGLSSRYYTYSSLDKEQQWDDHGNGTTNKNGNLDSLEALKKGVEIPRRGEQERLLGNVSYHWKSGGRTYGTNVKFKISAPGNPDRICDFDMETYPGAGNYCYSWLAINIKENIKNKDICYVSYMENPNKDWAGTELPTSAQREYWLIGNCTDGVRKGDRKKISIQIIDKSTVPVKPINPDWMRLQFFVVNGTTEDQTITMVNPEQDLGGGIFETTGSSSYWFPTPNLGRFTYSSLDKVKHYDDRGNDRVSDETGNLKHREELKNGWVIPKPTATDPEHLLGNVSYHWNSKNQTYSTNVKFKISAPGKPERTCDFKVETYPEDGDYCYDQLHINIESIKNKDICTISQNDNPREEWNPNQITNTLYNGDCSLGRRIGDKSKIGIKIEPVNK